MDEVGFRSSVSGMKQRLSDIMGILMTDGRSLKIGKFSRIQNIMKSFFDLLKDQSKLKDEDLQVLLAKWKKPKQLKRNDFLIRPGQVEDHLYFIQEGLLRIYYPQEDQEICVGFGYDQTLICSFPSLIDRQPSEYAIQALRKTTLTGITRSDLFEAIDERPALQQVWRQWMETALLGRITREIDLLTVSPRDRIMRLLSRNPDIFQRVPHKYIASYLRMSPETLSRNLSNS
jgi:CRP-like cAMP-binding protein